MIPRPVAVLALALAPLAATACVQRKMVIRSNPDDAIMVLDGQRLEERTPYEAEFFWDGSRSLVLMAPDHEVLETTVDLEERWHDHFPLDFVAEFIWPGTIEDVQEFDYTLRAYAPRGQRLSPAQEADVEARVKAVRARADRYRAGGSDGPTTSPAQPKAGDTPAPTPAPSFEGSEPAPAEDAPPPPPPK
jgi:hypothetical protein